MSLESNTQYFLPRRGDLLCLLPLLTLPYDSLTNLLGLSTSVSQTLPLTALLAMPYLVVRGRALRSTRSSSIVFRTLLFSFLAMFAVTFFNALIESAGFLRADIDIRRLSSLRQSISMLMGLSSYLMFQDAILRLGISVAARWLLLGSAPCISLGVVQLFFGDYRVQGFSSEPSHMADMLVFAFLPACAVADLPARTRHFTAMVGIILLIATFSTTGYLKALAAVGIYFQLSGKIGLRTIMWLLIPLFLGYIAFSIFPDNYVFKIIGFMYTTYDQTGQLVTSSFVDRFFGFAGPLSQLSGLHGWLGYGFGGDSVYFERLFDAETAASIRAVKSELPTISSLQGKMLMYGGFPGYALYLWAWKRSLLQVPRPHIARVMIPSIFVASLFSLGPLFLPYVWFWLAIGACASADRTLAQFTTRISRYSTPVP